MKLSLMLTDLRLPTISRLWQSFATRADKEGWTSIAFLPAGAAHRQESPGRQWSLSQIATRQGIAYTRREHDRCFVPRRRRQPIDNEPLPVGCGAMRPGRDS